MTGWNVSRHPEWDMMYAAGLTVREIADRCRQNVATIRLHLSVREKYAPGLRATHEAALAGRGPDRPTTAWRRRLDEALAFQAAHQRLPSNSGEGVEGSLARWVANQRTAYLSGRMSAAKVILLDGLEGWQGHPQQQLLDERWRSTLAALTAYVAAVGEMPRYKNYASEHERTLGVWLHTQHQRRSEGTLQSWRLEALDAAVPSWRSRS
ncbi:hypothetical protein GCM10010038_33840 [Glutamicibacter protophormiae]|nr:helicase associated domain-containing protein [Glutamicibacter protophormiae]GGM01007.1 hypothetical protein GCM10010038_33840 [Glutamicibacter protophormiae]